MPTATAETDTEQATVTFRSRDPEQVLTVRGAPSIPNGRGGQKVQTFEEYLADQKRKNEERELTNADPLPIDDMPWKIEFEHNTFQTSDPRVIEFLREHPTFNTNGPSGFFEEPAAPVDPEAAMVDPNKLIARAAAQGDELLLETIRDEERKGKNRPAIVEAAVVALETLAEESSEPEDAAGTGNGDQGESDGSDGAA